jgi:hypothetical protein
MIAPRSRKKGRVRLQAAQFREETPKEGDGNAKRYRTAKR